MPAVSCSPPPASRGHGAAGGGVSRSHAQRPPHSLPEGSGWPHLSRERSLPTHPLSCSYTHRSIGGGGVALHPSWGPSTQIRALGAGQGGQPRGPRCGPSSDLGWHPKWDTEPRDWGHRQGLPGLGSQGGSPCEARVWGLLLTPQGPGARWDSKKIQQSVGGGALARPAEPRPRAGGCLWAEG